MIKKGDLVKIDSHTEGLTVAMSITEPYITTFVHSDPITGKATLTEEKIVVDVVIRGRVIKKIPIETLQKVN